VLRGDVQLNEFLAFTSSFTSVPAALVSLVLPSYRPDNGDRKEAAVVEEAAALSTGVRRLLSRLTSLRHLQSCTDSTSGAFSGEDSCSARLYSLWVLHWPVTVRCPFTAPLSFPLLTELMVTLSLKGAELELLLSACPQLRTLDCTAYQSDQVVLIAARCCPGLLRLKARIQPSRYLVDDAAVAEQQPA
jgi:hypothetical protein